MMGKRIVCGCSFVFFVTVCSPHVYASFYDVARIAGSSLEAQRERITVIAENIANVDTLETPQGGPYQRQRVMLASGKDEKGVRVSRVYKDPTFILVYDPGNPYADENGYVKKPNVTTVTEMVDMMSAQRAYEASLQTFNASRTMAQRALSIGR